MERRCLISSADGRVSGHVTWASTSPDRQLGDVLVLRKHAAGSSEDPGEALPAPVFLEQTPGDGAGPCTLTLQCGPHSGAAISSLLVVSEARTMEVYCDTEYCGTCRGERVGGLRANGVSENIALYKKELTLDCPATSCEVKLLSLGGRSRVGIGQMVLGLKPAGPAAVSPSAGGSVDLQAVQCMMEAMGTTLSPGAQNLMDMVQFQQKNKQDVLGGFLPMLLGGGGSLAALVRGGIAAHTAGGVGLPAGGDGPQGTAIPSPAVPSQSAKSCPSGQPSGHGLTDTDRTSFRGQGSLGPETLPLLRGMCGAVTRLRGETGAPVERPLSEPPQERPCCRALEEAVERRLEAMERRLMEHIDLRLSALQRGLESTVMAVLAPGTPPLAPHNGPLHCRCREELPNGDA
ncbi:ATPase PAAT [Amia ocellicauda]|uniref:ATPase PAAT n=1 Tax=Amia ocellicauda TaxID=2972642 RepID=UPI00346488BA